jgi:hypothetical protein
MKAAPLPNPISPASIAEYAHFCALEKNHAFEKQTALRMCACCGRLRQRGGSIPIYAHPN